MSNGRQNSDWWSPVHPPDGIWLRGRIGHLAITLGRRGTEWLVNHEYEERVEDLIWFEQDKAEDPSILEAGRYIFQKSADHLELCPALADRPVIARPRTQVTVPSGHHTSVFVGTPLWVQLRAPSSQDLLTEFSTERLSHTWFGATTTRGEICYSTATAARLHAENLPRLPDYAVTKVALKNESDSPLQFKQIKLPVATLSIYRNGGGLHVTEPVTMVQTENELSRIDQESIADRDDDFFRGAKLVASPRSATSRGDIVSSALERLFN